MKNRTIKETKNLFAKKELKVEEVVLESISCFEKNKHLNILVTDTFDIAFEQAKKLDKKGYDGSKPLFGIPFTLKDVYTTKNIRTTASSNILRDYTPPYNATCYQKLLDAGAILLGKTNCDAWGHGSSTENSDFGVTKNPYDETRVPGGSSGGSATAVAVGGSTFDIGEDTGSSIRHPAAFCGVFGLKPTYGRVSRYGAIAFASSLDTVGPIATSTEDLGSVLQIIAGLDPLDATSLNDEVPDYVNLMKKPLKGLKIGLVKEYLSDGLDSEIQNKMQTALDYYLSCGATIKTVSLPSINQAIYAYYVVAPSECSSNLARFQGIRYGKTRDFFGKEAKRRILTGTFCLSAGYYDAFYKKATQIRDVFRQEFKKAFSEVDIILGPVTPTLPFKIGEKSADPIQMYLSDIYTVVQNLTGVPAVSVPCGFSKEGLPIAFQLTAPWLREDTLLQFSYAFENKA